MLIQKMFVKCVKSKTSLALIQFFVQLIQKCSFVVGVFYSLLYTILQKTVYRRNHEHHWMSQLENHIGG